MSGADTYAEGLLPEYSWAMPKECEEYMYGVPRTLNHSRLLISSIVLVLDLYVAYHSDKPSLEQIHRKIRSAMLTILLKLNWWM